MKRPISKTNLLLSCTAVLTGIILTTYLLAFSAPSFRSACANTSAACTEIVEDAAPSSLPVSSSIIFEAVTGHLLSTGFWSAWLFPVQTKSLFEPYLSALRRFDILFSTPPSPHSPSSILPFPQPPSSILLCFLFHALFHTLFLFPCNFIRSPSV